MLEEGGIVCKRWAVFSQGERPHVCRGRPQQEIMFAGDNNSLYWLVFSAELLLKLL